MNGSNIVALGPQELLRNPLIVDHLDLLPQYPVYFDEVTLVNVLLRLGGLDSSAESKISNLQKLSLLSVLRSTNKLILGLIPTPLKCFALRQMCASRAAVAYRMGRQRK